MRSYDEQARNAMDQWVQFGDFLFDFSSNSLHHQNQKVELQHKPSEVLALLLKSKGQLVSREEIIKAVWGRQIVDFDQNINFSIKCIRKALGDNPKSPSYVQTIPRKGYQFITQVNSRNNSPVLNSGNGVSILQYGNWMWLVIPILALGGMYYLFSKRQLTSSHAVEIVQATSQDLKRATYLLDKGDYQSIKISQKIFKRAVLNIKSAGVYSGLAIATLLVEDDRKGKERAEEYARLAYNKDSSHSSSQLAMGMVAFYLDWDIPKAKYHIKQATEITPESIRAWHELSVIQTVLGEYVEAKNSIEKALYLDPGRVQEVFHAGWFYLANKNHEKALEQCQKSIEINPSHTYSHLCVVEASLHLNLFQTAREHMMAYMKLLRVPVTFIDDIGSSSNNTIFNDFFRWRLSYLIDYGVDDFTLALAYAQFGDNDQALKKLADAIENQNMMVPTAWAYSQFQSIRKDQEFLDMMKTVKRY